jgi:hypothetical protein
MYGKLNANTDVYNFAITIYEVRHNHSQMAAYTALNSNCRTFHRFLLESLLSAVVQSQLFITMSVDSIMFDH